jgi:hypothetical protein
VNICTEFFNFLAVKTTAKTSPNLPIDLQQVEVRPLVSEEEKLKSSVLVFCAASRRLRARDKSIGWSDEQRRRRLPLVANNCRFLLLPDKTLPNLASRILSLATRRLSADWQQRYGHPVLLVETFIIQLRVLLLIS